MNDVSLSRFDHTRNADGGKWVTVIATFYSGCTPGRADYPSFTKHVSSLRKKVAAGFLGSGNVAFIASLKNGVNDGVAEAWAKINGSDVSTSASDTNGGFPYIVDDRHRSLVYKFFDAAVHPAYAIVDHCMTYRALLPALPDQTGEDTLQKTVERLLLKTDEACPVAPSRQIAAVRPRREARTFKASKNPSSVASACAPAFGTGPPSARRLGVPRDGSRGGSPLSQPRTLAFHPTRTGEIWVGNNDTDSVTILRGSFDGVKGAAAVSGVVHRFDRAHYHYMDKMAAMSFKGDGAVVTCQESENTYDGMKRANRFMGPSLYDTVPKIGNVKTGGWPEGKNIFVNASGAKCDPDGLSDGTDDNPTCFMTHTDMLHASPNCMGVAHDPEPNTPFGNVFWVFDGLNSTLIRYDFEQPHGPGSLDHSLANVRRYPEIKLTRVPGVPGHMTVDPETRALFIADTGGGRVLAVDADSGRYAAEARNDLGGNFTLWSSPLPSFEYTLFGCASFKTFATGIDKPSGLALSGNVLYVGEHGTGKIIALHRTTGEKLGEYATGAKKLFGLSVNPTSGRLWYVDGAVNDAVFYLEPSAECAEPVPDGAAIAWPASTVSESGTNWCGISTSVATLGLAVKHIQHEDGYLNMTPLGPGYGVTDECMKCGPGCDNDMLLMSGFLCHKCIPDNCRGGIYPTSAGTCENIIGEGYRCKCDDGAYGDHCQFRVVSGSERWVPNFVGVMLALLVAIFIH